MQQRGGARPASVLVVDDEIGMREMMLFVLTQDGFDVETAEGGSAALEAVRRRRFDLAITDLKMPGMDGIETAQALRALDPAIEIILATGCASDDIASDCAKHGVFDHIQKPFDLSKLRDLLGQAIERRRTARGDHAERGGGTARGDDTER